MPPPPTPPAPAGFFRAFLTSAVGTGLSRVAGAARDIALAGVLGAGAGSDAFWIAFTIPAIMRRFVADEGLTGVLVPSVAEVEKAEGTAVARRVVDASFSLLLLANVVICALGMLFPEVLVKAFAWSFAEDPAKLALTARLTTLLFPFLLFVSLVSFLEGILNHRGHFFVPKVAPALPSLFMVAAALTLAGRFEHPEYAVAAGTLVGGLLHVLVNFPLLLRLWGPIRPSAEVRLPRVRAMVAEMGKVIAIGLFAQVQILVLRQLAAGLEEGSVTRYWYANRVIELAQGTIAVGIGSALLPAVSRAIAAGDWERFRDDFGYGVRLAAFMLVPVAAVVVGFSVPITAVLFRVGRFTLADAEGTAATLVGLVPFLLALAGINIAKKAYFALGDRNTLLVVGAAGVALTALLGLWWTAEWGITGLGYALSASTTLQMFVYFALLRRRLGARLGLGAQVASLGRITLASAPVSVLLLGVGRLGRWEDGPASLRNLAVVGLGLAAAAGLYVGVASLLGVREVESIRNAVRRLRRSAG